MNRTLVFSRWVSGVFVALLLGIFSGCGGGTPTDSGKATDPAPSSTQDTGSGVKSATNTASNNQPAPATSASLTPSATPPGTATDATQQPSGQSVTSTGVVVVSSSSVITVMIQSDAGAASGSTSGQATSGIGTTLSSLPVVSSGVVAGSSPVTLPSSPISGSGGSTSTGSTTAALPPGSGSSGSSPGQTPPPAGTGITSSSTPVASSGTGTATGGGTPVPSSPPSTSGITTSTGSATVGLSSGSAAGVSSGQASPSPGIGTTPSLTPMAAPVPPSPVVMGSSAVRPEARLKVTYSSPVAGASGAPANGAVVLNFSEEMRGSDINSTTFTVNDGVSNLAGTVTYDGLTATFIPAAPLGLHTVNTVTLAGSVRDLAGNPTGTPFTYAFMTGDTLDFDPPLVTSTSPMSDATGVYVNRFIALNFNEAVNASDITSTSLTVVKDSDGSNVPGVVSYSGLTAAFTPSSELAHGTSYTVTLAGSVRDLSGNEISVPYQYSFTTGNGRDTLRPKVKTKSPFAGTMFVSTDTDIVLTFSEVMIATDITAETFKVQRESDGAFISGSVIFDRLKGTFTPDSALDPDTSYAVSISCAVRDLALNALIVKDTAGNVLPCNQFSSYTFKTAPDQKAPSILSSAPSGFATGIYVDSPIILNFSEKMNASTITSSTFVVNDGVNDIPGTIIYSGTKATFWPDSNLAHDHEYTVIVSGDLEDASGNRMEFSNQIIFTTALPGYVSFLAKLPDTGQTASYTDTFGEDSDYTLASPSYTDNGNGTVTDNMTRLMWQKQDDSVLRNWRASLDYCGSLTLAGHTDWRLPTIFELESITDSDVESPSINSTYFPGTSAYPYWSYTTSAGPTSMGWYVSFSRGNVEFNFKASNFNARCVR